MIKSNLTNSVLESNSDIKKLIQHNLDLIDYSAGYPLKEIYSILGLEDFVDDTKFRHQFIKQLRLAGFETLKNRYHPDYKNNVTLWRYNPSWDPKFDVIEIQDFSAQGTIKGIDIPIEKEIPPWTDPALDDIHDGLEYIAQIRRYVNNVEETLENAKFRLLSQEK